MLGLAFLLSIFYHSSEDEVTAAVEMIRGTSAQKKGGTRVAPTAAAAGAATATATATAGGGGGGAAGGGGEGVRGNSTTGKGARDADGTPHNEDKAAGASYLFQRRFQKARAAKAKRE